jgi:Fe-S-cluster containining protein
MATTRTCGTCTMCCKVFKIPALDKPAGTWCTHCIPGNGCKVYADRPILCRQFECLWLEENDIPEIWKPERSKMVLSTSPTTGFMHVQVDPGQPSAWQKQPYHSHLLAWSARLLAEKRHILVLVNDDATLILPKQALHLGHMREDESFLVKQRFGSQGIEYYVERFPTGPSIRPKME